MPLNNAAADALGNNPFAVLTFVAAPALLTNASSVLTLGTSNRFARAVDRARTLSAQLDAGTPGETLSEKENLHLAQLDIAERRVLLVVRALGAFYVAVGSFALATLASLVGASLVLAHLTLAERVAQWVALAAGVSGVSALMVGASLLVFESRMTRGILHLEAEFVRRRVRERREQVLAKAEG